MKEERKILKILNKVIGYKNEEFSDIEKKERAVKGYILIAILSLSTLILLYMKWK